MTNENPPRIPKETPREVIDIRHGEGMHFGLKGLALIALCLLAAGLAIYLPIAYQRSGWLCLIIPAAAGLGVALGGRITERLRRRVIIERGELHIGQLQQLEPISKGAFSATVSRGVSFPLCVQKRYFVDPEQTVREGDEVAILLHPTELIKSEAVLPELEGIVFDVSEDLRPRLERRGEGEIAEAEPVGEVSAKLSDGEVRWDGEGLSQRRGGEEARVRWDEPLVVQLAAWLLSRQRVELAVTVRNRGLAGEGARFVVELPQNAVDREIPMQQVAAPRMRVEDFKRLWPTLQWYAALHGEVVEGVDLAREAVQRRRAVQNQRLERLFGPTLGAVATLMVTVGVLYGTHPVFEQQADCEAGRVDACLTLVDWYKRGQYVSVDPEASLRYAKRGCDLKSAQGCFEAAELSDDVKLHARACRLKHVEACFRIEDFARACEAGDGSSCLREGQASQEHAPRLALPLFIQGCNLGSKGACCRVAQMHLDGHTRSSRATESGCQLAVRNTCAALLERPACQ